MSDQSLALLKAQVPSAEAMTGMLAVATALVEARMVPVGITKPGQALALILTGREMGIGPMRSVQDLYQIKGNVGMLTRFMVAQFRLAGHYHDILVKTVEHCKVRLHLREGREVIVEFTRDEVNALGYPYFWKKPDGGGSPVKTLKPQWKSDPAGLLYNRTMTKGIRAHAPECLYGLLTHEEIQDRRVAAGESRLVAFLKEQHPDVWAEWAETQEPEQPADQGKVINGESREIPPAEDNGQGEPTADKHWIDKKDTAGRALRTVFWEFALADLGLQRGEVYEALGTTVEQQFPGMEETKALLQAYIDKHAQPAGEPPTQAGSLDEEEIPF